MQDFEEKQAEITAINIRHKSKGIMQILWFYCVFFNYLYLMQTEKKNVNIFFCLKIHSKYIL